MDLETVKDLTWQEINGTISRKDKKMLLKAIITDVHALRLSISIYEKIPNIKKACNEMLNAEQIIAKARRNY